MNYKNKQRLTALTLASTLLLSGCSVNNKFKLTENENNELVAMDESYIDNKFMNDYYLVEVYNNMKEQNEIYIASRRYLRYRGYVYYDVFTNLEFVNDYEDKESLLEFVKVSSLNDYIISFGLGQYQYSYDDMKNIYEIIKENYVFENDKKKKKVLTKDNI